MFLRRKLEKKSATAGTFLEFAFFICCHFFIQPSQWQCVYFWSLPIVPVKNPHVHSQNKPERCRLVILENTVRLYANQQSSIGSI